MRPDSLRLSVAILCISIPSRIVIKISISLGCFWFVHIDPIRATLIIPSSCLISSTNHCVQSKRTDRSVGALLLFDDWIFGLRIHFFRSSHYWQSTICKLELPINWCAEQSTYTSWIDDSTPSLSTARWKGFPHRSSHRVLVPYRPCDQGEG